MEIVFVHWNIVKGREEEFKQYWKSGLPVNDRTGLVGEFLSQPSGHGKYDWVRGICVLPMSQQYHSTSVCGRMLKLFICR